MNQRSEMLTMMCPNCRHRFPAPGCCHPTSATTAVTSADPMGGCGGVHPPDCGNFYGGPLLVPRGYTSGGGCFINAPTVIHGPTIVQGQTIQGSNGFVNSLDRSRDRISSSYRQGKENHQPLFGGGPLRMNDIAERGPFEMSGGVSQVLGGNYPVPTECHITTTCDLTGGSVTITTPSIQSGGCLIQSTDSGILVQAPRIEIRPKLSGGGCFVQKNLSTEEPIEESILDSDEAVGDLAEACYSEENLSSRCDSNPQCGIFQNPHPLMFVPPSGCQELPGTRRSTSPKLLGGGCCMSSFALNQHSGVESARIHDHYCCDALGFGNCDAIGGHHCHPQWSPHNAYLADVFLQEHAMCSPSRNPQGFCCVNSSLNARCDQARNYPPFGGDVAGSSVQKLLKCFNGEARTSANVSAASGSVIQVNATVQLPPNVDQCTVNITATTNNANSGEAGRSRNNFNGGGLVQPENIAPVANVNNNERRNGAPPTPISWLMPCPWGFDSYLLEKDIVRLNNIKRLLNESGWYYEGLSWQQSEALLKDTPVGTWLLRNSSDSRFTFAVSVQTARGPTSIRVHYLLGRFRLDAEPRLALAMPLFECPIKMLEYYVEYSKRIDEHREVWVDYNGQFYSQIYLTKPLVKQIRSLSHMSRMVANKNNLPIGHLPPPIQHYLCDYPYLL